MNLSHVYKCSLKFDDVSLGVTSFIWTWFVSANILLAHVVLWHLHLQVMYGCFYTGSEWVLLSGRWLCAQVLSGDCRHGTQIPQAQPGGYTATLSEGESHQLNYFKRESWLHKVRHLDCYLVIYELYLTTTLLTPLAMCWHQPGKHAEAVGSGGHHHPIGDCCRHVEEAHSNCCPVWWDFSLPFISHFSLYSLEPYNMGRVCS